MTCTLFISDLHLDRHRPATTRLFVEFLHTEARAAQALYILGDLFETWIGDEDIGRYREVIEALGACTAAGTQVLFMPGNRDFLVGTAFASASGCRLLTDPVRIDLYGDSVLLTHGDILCTDDLPYQTFRQRVRDSGWQRTFLDKPLGERRRIAEGFRDTSRTRGRLKPAAVLDVNEQAILDTMSGYRVSVLVHGHTHRQCVYELEVDGRPARRLALGDWAVCGSVLECAGGDWQFRTFRPETTDAVSRRPA